MMKRALVNAVNSDGSLNRISVDSDQSTSDTVVLLSSCKRPGLGISPDEEERIFTDALRKICSELAQDIVRNGEGTSHVIRITVSGAPSAALAHGTAKAVVNSPLVKAAIAGNDANVGRIICAVGGFVGKHFPSFSNMVQSQCEIYVGREVVFRNGEFTIDPEKEKRLFSYLKNTELPVAVPYPAHYRTVDIIVDLRGTKERQKGFSSTAYGSDLTENYVAINGGYRS
jgi:glutamate N-acetyltransferase/amino-acid N-acetyltransferase